MDKYEIKSNYHEDKDIKSLNVEEFIEKCIDFIRVSVNSYTSEEFLRDDLCQECIFEIIIKFDKIMESKTPLAYTRRLIHSKIIRSLNRNDVYSNKRIDYSGNMHLNENEIVETFTLDFDVIKNLLTDLEIETLREYCVSNTQEIASNNLGIKRRMLNYRMKEIKNKLQKYSHIIKTNNH